MQTTFTSSPLGSVTLLPGLFQHRTDLNRQYMLSLKTANLLQNFYMEAGLWGPRDDPGDDIHWGWEAPTCQLRGHFLGHWLSAAARMAASTGDPEIKGKADQIVAELGRCQRENGGEWVFSIPAGYLDWIARGKRVWAPHYTIHKTLMGLADMVIYGGNSQALEILERAARWFHRWTAQFSREQMDDILDVETGGMLEAWADLYGLTGRQAHLDLIHRYDRPRLFDRLLAGDDPLTNRHANTTIPEAHGAARAFEVTGDARWRKIVEAYWQCAVTDRGYYATGSQTDGEIWTAPFELSARLSDKNQEHCVVYNMVRLANFLLRWTGDATYADYMERNLYNGTLAQQNDETGMVAYFLPLQPGGHKGGLKGEYSGWGTPTHDFWCCHGSLVQAHTTHNAYVYYKDDDGVAVCQYIPTELRSDWAGAPVTVRQAFDPENSTSAPAGPDGAVRRPKQWAINLSVQCAGPADFALKLRVPWWIAGPPRVTVNGAAQAVSAEPSSFIALRRTWTSDTVRIELPTALTTCPLPDRPDSVAFMDGPIVLAGLCDEERTLHGDPAHPEKLLIPDHEREWSTWKGWYRTTGQERGIRFVPLYEVKDERYTVYFPVRP
jgi:hypothetical protein